MSAPDLTGLCDSEKVFLTFDDGPSSSVTPRILDALNRHAAKATFFVVGSRLQRPGGAAIVKALLSQGHAVGNHSFTHPDLTECSETEIENELNQTAAVLKSLGIVSRLFRPPYGQINESVQKVAERLGYDIIGWDNDARDWAKESKPDHWVRRIVANLRDYNARIVLCHDIHKTTADHLDQLLQTLVNNGYRMVTLAEGSTVVDSKSEAHPPLWPILPGGHRY